MTLEDGSEYEGEWLLGTQIRQGKGVLLKKDGSLYEGYFINNLASGKGRTIHANGDYYQGQHKEDKAHGFGTYQYKDGSKHSGLWQNNK